MELRCFQIEAISNMIYIKEGKPTKISGLTSFYITFDYAPPIVEAIKSLPVWNFYKKDYS